MALATTTYANGIKALMDELFNNPANLTTDQARTKWSNDFAALTETYIKTGDVQSGIPLSSTGTSTNHTGSTTGIGKMI